MANTLLTSDIITREALRILHQKSTFLSRINRQYDNSFAQSSAKIGDTLRIRLPNQYTVRDGPTYAGQDTVEESTSLAVRSIKGVDMTFTQEDLTMKLDDFSANVIEPAIAGLAASIEADCLAQACNDVYQVVGSTADAITFRDIMLGRKRLNDSLAPSSNRTALLNTTDNVELVDALKGLFQDSTNVAKQYTEGYMGRTGGFDFMESTLFSRHNRGAADVNYLTNSATAQTGNSLIVDTGAGAASVGDVFTIGGVFEVHPETKVSTGVLKQFVVTSAYAGGAGTIQFSPAIVTTGGRQNVSNGAANNQPVLFYGTASTAFGQSLLFNRDAFTFATADFIMPSGVDMAARKTIDGISMTMARQYDIDLPGFKTRIDVLYGFKTIRPELAVRVASV
jgi:hypothetical protein